jgi:hypothetical protein
MEPQQQPQIYDATLKSFFGDEVTDILPALIPGAEFISECNVELDRTIIKPDLVFLGRLNGELCIINMELQSNEDTMMELRLLLYHVALHHKHKIPVVSVILYPFEAKYPVPPYRERSGKNTLLKFKYGVYVLCEKDARKYVHRHRICLYTLLPGMKHATVPLLKQALREMRQHYTNDKRFGDHLARFQTIMWRSTTMSEPEKREIEEELKMVYTIDRFIDGNPYIENRIEKAAAERAEKIAAERIEKIAAERIEKIAAERAEKIAAERIEKIAAERAEKIAAERKAQGMAQGMQRLMLDAIKERFPALANQAQPRIERIQDTDALETLFRHLLTATTESDARRILQIQEQQ